MELIPDPNYSLAIFAVQVEINGKRFPQGVGMTKKEAKKNAAKKAFKIAVLHEDGKSVTYYFLSVHTPTNTLIAGKRHVKFQLYQIVFSKCSWLNS